MLTWYGILKVVHVLSTVVWIGGGVALAVITHRMVRARDRAALTALLPHSAKFGPLVGGPASGLVLLTGIAMVIVGQLDWALWTQLGFLAIALHLVFGGVVMRTRVIAFA